MKKIFRGIGRTIKPFVNFPSWMGWKQIAQGGSTIKTAAKSLMDNTSPDQPIRRKETFEQAVVRLRLSPEDLKQRMKQFRMMAFLYGAIGLGLFVYTIILFINFSIMAGLLSVTLSALAFALAFRQHFWYFQMKQRKLGCTVKEWFHGTFGGAR